MELRQYQVDAIEAIYEHLRTRDDNPCAVLPTGSGKTPIIATLCKDAVLKWGGRVIVLAHVKELLEQSLDKLRVMAPEMGLQVGIHSASLKRRDTEHSVLVAGIQSVYKRACEIGPINLVIVDEAHLIPPSGDGRYLQFIRDARVVNPELRVIGFTATPYRMASGMLCGPDNVLNKICYEVSIRDLIEQGYLSLLRSKVGKDELDFDSLHVRAGEFIESEVNEMMNKDELVDAACREIVKETETRRSVLIFGSSIAHAENIVSKLREITGAPVSIVTGSTILSERASIIDQFKSGHIRYLVNVNVLTTGFDAPNVDCVALVRPTKSPGLYYQACGRGFRLAPGKSDCLILDFGGNILRHGPVDAIRITEKGAGKGGSPVRVCPECQEIVKIQVRVCPGCGFLFPEPEREPHAPVASTLDVISKKIRLETYPVQRVTFSEHQSKDRSKPTSMKVIYQINNVHYEFEWICLNHTGWTRMRAESWWRRRSNTPPPPTVGEAIRLANAGALCQTMSIEVRQIEGLDKYPKIVGYELGEKPPAITLDALEEEYIF